ncbi:MAG: hypothetical protein JOY79_01235 [Acidobacteriaceae bacterium]|nr:hypothetical protein [Acidobacteriaceae bacterium]
MHCMAGRGTFSVSVDQDNTTYAPVDLPEGFVDSIILPRGLEAHGSTRELLETIERALLSSGTVDEEGAAIAAHFALATSVTGLTQSAPFLVVSGPVLQAVEFLRMLRRCCRHGLALAEISPRTVRAIPFSKIRPSVVALSLASDAGSARWLHGSTFAEFLTASGASLQSCLAPKAVCLQDGQPVPAGAVPVHLHPNRTFVRLSDEELAAVEAAVQPRLLSYRLAFHASIASGRPVIEPSCSVASQAFLDALFEEDARAAAMKLLRFDEQTEQTERSSCPESITIECLLAVCHEGKRQVRVNEVAELVNTTLTLRGELELSARGLGETLKRLRLLTERLDSQSRGLKFSKLTRRRLHRLAYEYGIPAATSKIIKCEFCSETWGGDVSSRM